MMMPLKKVIAMLLLLFGLYSCTCNSTSENDGNVPKIDPKALPAVSLKIKRYEKALFSLDQKRLGEELKRIQPEYAVFLDGDLNDKNNIQQLKNYLITPEIINNYDACMKVFPELDMLEKQLSGAFSHYKYYFPEKRIPAVYTYVSGGDFNEPVKWADSSLIIALDIYLGQSFPMYAACGIPLYKSRFMDSLYITRDCMESIMLNLCSNDVKNPNFLDQMVGMGKVMYLLDLVMPGAADSVKLKYSGANLIWLKKNEGNIWSFFIENKILYSTDHDVFLKFFGDAPFTTAFGKNSPPRIAIWVGLQIIRAYMNETADKSVKKMISESDSQKILQISKYKPRKEN